VEKAVDEFISQMDAEQIAVSTAAVITDEPAKRQREIAAMPPTEQRERVTALASKDSASSAARVRYERPA
jgi:hypothetical protein